MTVQDAGGGQWRPWVRFVLRHTRWLRPALMWAGHYSLWLTIPWIAVAFADDAAGRPGWLAHLALAAWGILWFTLTIDSGYHYARLCERCAAATPLDPQAAVDRWRRVLRLDHRRRFVTAIILAAFIWALGVGYMLISGVHSVGLPAHHHNWAYLLQDVPIVLLIACYFVVNRIHRALYPWCPWCRWDGGGDHEGAPDPGPEDHGVPLPRAARS
jgi:hypothetical protein